MKAKPGIKTTDIAAGILTRKVRDISRVDGKMLAGTWPPGVNTLRFIPGRPVLDVYGTLNRNIPARYKVRLTYLTGRADLRIPPEPKIPTGLRTEPFGNMAGLLKTYRKVLTRSFLKPYFPGKTWAAEMAPGMAYIKAHVRPGNAFSVLRGKARVGLLLLSEQEYEGRIITGVGWIWLDPRLTVFERRHAQRLLLLLLKKKMRPVAGAGIDGFNPASMGFFTKAGFSLRALSVSKNRTSLVSPPGRMTDLDWARTYKAAWRAIMDADYGKAMGLLTPGYRKYPRDFRVARTYAMVLGDYAEALGGARLKPLKRRSCALLAGLLKKLSGVRWELNISTRNEYYYHTAQFDKQYRLGLEAAAGGHFWAHYSQGVGAANYAYDHASKGRARLARLWAERAVAAWEEFFKFKADYYNAYVHYSLALGILGRFKEAEAALQKSARLSGKPASYKEFLETREKLAALRSPAG
ncbi:MAG: tetratricopeptide repeat protein [Elusimicrobiales bacterium]|nr:tetratricopeptide repeat protein [Elusimicrobiales bacterium]